MTLPYQAHSATSFEAARSMEPHAKIARERVYDTIVSSWGGMTAQEVGLALGMPGDTVRPLIVELKRRNRIREAGKRQTASGRWAVVWAKRGDNG